MGFLILNVVAAMVKKWEKLPNAINRTLFVALVISIKHLLIPSLVESQEFLTDPILQNPTSDSVNIVWFTEFEGEDHYVEYGKDFLQKVPSCTKKLSRMREDDPNGGCKERSIYRHEAHLKDLSSSERLAYRVVSVISKIETIK